MTATIPVQAVGHNDGVPPLRRGRRSARPGSFSMPNPIRIMLWIWVIFNMFMAIWVGLNSLKTDREIFGAPFGLPASPQWQNFVTAWSYSGFGGAALNSVAIVAISAVLTIAIAAPAAYVISRSARRLAAVAKTYVALCVALPVQTILVPLFIARTEVRTFAIEYLFGWWDDRITLLFIYVATSLPFSVFLLTAAFASLPKSLNEAAELDGASAMDTFVRIMVPVAWPAIKSALILNALNMWNETLLVLVLIPNPSQQTLPAALLRLYGTMQYNSNWGGLFAGIVILIYPVLVLYLWVGRRIMEGLTSGATK